MKAVNKKFFQQGQSLVEVLSALAVLVVVILGLAQVTTTSVRNSNFAKNRAQATDFAQEALERVRLYRGENNWPAFVLSCNAGTIDLGSIDSQFTFLPLVCQLPGSSTPCQAGSPSCEVVIQVSWSEGHKDYQSILTTHFTDWQ